MRIVRFLLVYDGQGRELLNARVEQVSPAEIRITAPGLAPLTVANRQAAVTLTQVTVTHTLETQPNVTLQQTGGGQVSPFRAGLPLTEELTVEAAFTNIAGRNNRVHGSGIDSPGTPSIRNCAGVSNVRVQNARQRSGSNP